LFEYFYIEKSSPSV